MTNNIFAITDNPAYMYLGPFKLSAILRQNFISVTLKQEDCGTVVIQLFESKGGSLRMLV